MNRVVYLGTFSKIFAPGVRLGWVHAHPDLLHTIELLKQRTDLCSLNLSQMLVYTFFKNSDWRGYVRRLTDVYRQRRDKMLEALTGFMPGEVHWIRPEGKFFIWVVLPSYVDAATMLDRAIDRNVAYVPGESFYTGGRGTNCIRLNFSFVEPREIWRGTELLAEVVREQLETGTKRGAPQRSGVGNVPVAKAV